MGTVTILGAGISGLGVSFHIGHDRCVLYEARPYYGGHIYSEQFDGVTWDDGPHVSFTDNEYVRRVLAESVSGEYEERPTCVSNYYRGHWIEHPAQSNLYQIPEPLRTECLNSFLKAREQATDKRPANYQEWLYQAFGRVFADTFPAAYTRKYWATEPANLGLDWIGRRVFYPKIEDVTGGYKGPLGRTTYWVTKWRYPSFGGFLSYAHMFAKGGRIQYNKSLTAINFRTRQMAFADGSRTSYDRLVSTIPIPTLISCCQDAPEDVREAASALRCTSLLLVRVAAKHASKRPEQWAYVYDKDKLSTRISIQENFSPHNAPARMSGMSVEVCGSAYKPLPSDHGEVASTVQRELVEMGLLESLEAVLSVRVHYIPWGQVIYDHNRRSALQRINSFLDSAGVVSAGRYAQWAYLMTHDCVLRSKNVADHLDDSRVELLEADIS